MHFHRIKKIIATLYIFATLLGLLHHHHDFKPHHECPICILQANLNSADAPTPVPTLSNVATFSQAIVSPLASMHRRFCFDAPFARAPPID